MDIVEQLKSNSTYSASFTNFSITVQMDDDMVKHYINEDTVLLEVHQVDENTHDITLVEYDVNAANNK